RQRFPSRSWSRTKLPAGSYSLNRQPLATLVIPNQKGGDVSWAARPCVATHVGLATPARYRPALPTSMRGSGPGRGGTVAGGCVVTDNRSCQPLVPQRPMIEPSCSTHFLIGAAQIRAHARDAIGGPRRANARVADELRDVVGLHGAVEADRAQLAHHPIHVLVAVVGKSLHEMGQRAARVAGEDVQ